MNDKPKIGSTALLIRGSQVLAIECAKGRGLILPGGKYEDTDATYERAAARELEEETGIIPVGTGDWVFGNINTDGYYVNTFRYLTWRMPEHIIELGNGMLADRLAWYRLTPLLKEGVPKWIDINRFLADESDFHPYYSMLFRYGKSLAL